MSARIQAGQTWRTRAGETVVVSSANETDAQIARDGALGYGVDATSGRWSTQREHGLDLVERIVPPDPVKPPLGLRPRWVTARARQVEILEAMERYAAEDKPVPRDWVAELSVINEYLYDWNLK